ncbi:hypothetical protein TcWFU_009909 [Taenia crassiceps]|uniref:RRM domain-containing protein n=1 Tax=Taenia crassiceps TaxID=6207 RepID=A0ABR4QFY7_9CEST
MRDSASPSNSYKRDESAHSRGRSRSRSRSPTPKSYRRRRSRSSSRDYRSRRASGYSSSYGYRRGQPRDNPVPSRCIGVFGLSLSTTERDLYDLFSRYGEVEDVTIVYDNFTCHSRGFGFVYMRHLSDAKEAKHDAHGTELDGRPIRVFIWGGQQGVAVLVGAHLHQGDGEFCTSLYSFRSERDNMNRNEKIIIIYVEVNVDEISESNIHENNFATE